MPNRRNFRSKKGGWGYVGAVCQPADSLDYDFLPELTQLCRAEPLPRDVNAPFLDGHHSFGHVTHGSAWLPLLEPVIYTTKNLIGVLCSPGLPQVPYFGIRLRSEGRRRPTQGFLLALPLLHPSLLSLIPKNSGFDGTVI